MVTHSNTKNRLILSKFKRKILKHVKIVRFVILALLIAVILAAGAFTYRVISKSVIGTSVGLARNFLFPTTTGILTANDRINILILGVGGAGHDSPDLTDTMIFASVSTISKKISLVSLPRDIWVPSLRDKINSAYMYGKGKAGTKAGLILAKSTAEDVLGQKIGYAVLLDFSAFKDVVDTLGGVTVEVKNSFTDNQYPIAGKENDNCNGDITFACRYTTVTFNSGPQEMNGDRALEFVRSRHASGIEGSDIARSARQQLVISAIAKKALNFQQLSNLRTDNKLFQIVMDNVETDLTPYEEATLSRYLVNAKGNLKSYTIPDALLYNPPNEYKYFNNLYSHAYVFIPARADGTWSDVQSWVKTVLP
ncbi:MAG TPA: LCP family protein [Candidatus Saccharimonadales bacterium]|nr:LCP family protein [Candidatus Saccharimonadales bacterium]